MVGSMCCMGWPTDIACSMGVVFELYKSVIEEYRGVDIFTSAKRF